MGIFQTTVMITSLWDWDFTSALLRTKLLYKSPIAVIVQISLKPDTVPHPAKVKHPVGEIKLVVCSSNPEQKM